MTVRAHDAATPAGVEEIARLFRGRRRAARTDCRRPVQVSNGRRSFHAKTVNLSRLGALIEIEDAGFLPPDSTPSLLDVAAAVAAAFPRSMRIRFPRARIAVSATVVRVAGSSRAGAAVLGCSFATPLTRRACRELGVLPDTKGDPAER